MDSSTEKRPVFLGTYFDRDAVLKAARLAGVLSWVLLGYSIYSALASTGQSVLMLASGAMSFEGMTVFDRLSILTLPLAQLVPGLLYFSMLKVGQQVLLILLEVEDNSRRSARK